MRERLAAAGLQGGAGAAYLLHLLGVKTDPEALGALSPEAMQARTFETLRHLVLRASRRQPLALIVENLHWVDRASEEFLASLVDVAARRAHVAALHLPPRVPAAVERQVVRDPDRAPAARAPRTASPSSAPSCRSRRVSDPLAETILARAEGNPFFLEELVLVVAERSPDCRAGGRCPTTVQDVLLARIRPAVGGREVGRSRRRRCWAARCRSISSGRSGRGRARSSPSCAS